jgi:hypothetical protein
VRRPCGGNCAEVVAVAVVAAKGPIARIRIMDTFGLWIHVLGIPLLLLLAAVVVAVVVVVAAACMIGEADHTVWIIKCGGGYAFALL